MKKNWGANSRLKGERKACSQIFMDPLPYLDMFLVSIFCLASHLLAQSSRTWHSEHPKSRQSLKSQSKKKGSREVTKKFIVPLLIYIYVITNPSWCREVHVKKFVSWYFQRCLSFRLKKKLYWSRTWNSRDSQRYKKLSWKKSIHIWKSCPQLGGGAVTDNVCNLTVFFARMASLRLWSVYIQWKYNV